MDRSQLQAHLALAEEHVAQGERHLARQREIIERMTSAGWNTKEANALLIVFQQTLAMHIADRDRLQSEIGKAS